MAACGRAVLPARSETDPPTVVAPSAVTTTGAGQAPGSMPEPPSVQVKVTVAEAALLQPAAFGAGATAAAMVGGVWSAMRASKPAALSDAVATLPAASTTWTKYSMASAAVT